MGLQNRESLGWRDFETPEWESQREKPFGCRPHGKVQGEPLAGREATAPSVITEIKEVQGREQAPRNGNLALSKDTAVKPFDLKGLFNV